MILRYPHCELDLDALQVRRGGEEHKLSPIEASLLRHLSASIGEVVDRYELLEAVWGVDSDKVVSRAVDVAVCRLRRKIERDPADPELVMTVPGSGYRLAAPPDEPPPRAHNLPPLVGRFIGREHELRWLHETLLSARVAVLRGAPGIGKTRLARQYAQSIIDGHAPPPGGVWFCDLSDAEREDEVLDAVSWALGLSPTPEAPPAEAWRRCVEAAHWRGGLLLVLDNAEGVTEVIDRLVADLAAGPKVRVLVTTQHSLAGGWPERELLPLADPASRVLLSARAFELGADLGPGPDEATAELLALLEGVPLAVELAAAQLRGNSLRQLVDRLSAGALSLPAAPDVTQGRSSLKAALRVALDRLEPTVRAALLAVSVFEGGAPIDGLQVVAEQIGVPPSALPAALERLRRSSLLSREALRPARYRMLASVRLAVQQRCPGPAAAATAALGAWLIEAAQRWREAAEGADPPAALDRLHEERANLRGAERALDRVAPALAAQLCLHRAWAQDMIGRPAEDPDHLQAAMERWREAAPPAVWARLAYVRARRLRTLSRVAEARAALHAGVAHLERAPLEAAEADAKAVLLVSLADSHRVAGDLALAESLLDEALALATAPESQARAYATLGLCCSYRSDFDGAEAHLERARLALQAELPGRELVFVLNSLAANAGRRGQEALAGARYAEARALAAHLRYESQQKVAEMGLAQRSLSAGRVSEAREHLLAVLRFERASGDRRMQGFALGTLGIAALEEGDVTEARALMQEAQEAFGERERLGAGQARALCALIDLAEGALEAGLSEAGAVLESNVGDADLEVMTCAIGGALAAAADQPALAEARFAQAAAVAARAPRHLPLLAVLQGNPEALRAAPSTPHQLVRIAARVIAARA